MWKCPDCDTEFDDSVEFCKIDGTPKVKHVSKPVEPTDWICQSCHTMNDGLYCKNCGRKKGTSLESAPNYQSNVVQKSTEQGTPRQWTCAKCKTMNPETMAVCMYCRTPRYLSSNAELREKLDTAGERKNGARIVAFVCIGIILCLFAVPYCFNSSQYTVYYNIQGYNGEIEKACSIVALLFTLLPAPFLLMKLDVRKRNLPFTIALISAGAISIYGFVIFFGSASVNGVMLFIVALQCLIAFFAYRYVKLLEMIENLLFRGGL